MGTQLRGGRNPTFAANQHPPFLLSRASQFRAVTVGVKVTNWLVVSPEPTAGVTLILVLNTGQSLEVFLDGVGSGRISFQNEGSKFLLANLK